MNTENHLTIHYLAATLLFLFSSTTFAENLLLTPEQAATQADSLCIVDVRSAEDFLEERIPGSVWLFAKEFSEERYGIPGLLPAPKTLFALLAERGISTDMHLVLYAANTTTGDAVAAARVFWVLEYLGYPHVSILDGGFSRWKAEGRALTSTPPKTPLPPVPLPACPKTQNNLAEKKDVEQAMENDAVVLVDARIKKQYSGVVLIRGTKRKGHIPSAINIPYSATMTMPHAAFRSLDDLKTILYPAGITRETPVIAYCNTGNSSSLIYFAYRLMGHEQITSYDGGIIEWSADAKLPVITSRNEAN